MINLVDLSVKDRWEEEFDKGSNKDYPNIEILWASTREVFNVIQAERCGCDIITMTPSLIKAMDDIGRDLDEYSLDTVKMFYKDATEAGFNV